MRGLTLGLAIAVTAVAVSECATAATITSLYGALQVNMGNGFRPIAHTVEAAPGAAVMVAPGGKGEILYSDGCRISVMPGLVATVAPVSPCAQGQAANPQGQAQGQRTDRTGDQIDYWPFAEAGLTMGAVAGIIYLTTPHGGGGTPVAQHPASP